MSSPAALPSLPPQLDLTGSIARLTLHRPEAANRLSLADLAVLEAHLEAVEQAASIRVLVLRAVGRSFCAGFDLRELSGQNDPGARFEAVADRLENLRQITVCCLEGGVYGGGTDLALACDFRIGSPACEMFVPAVRLGLHYYGGAMQRCVQRLGLQAAKRLLLAAEPFSAAEMLACGFLTELSDAPAILCEALSERLAGFAPLALLPMKQHLNALARHRLDSQQLAADIAQSLQSEDLAEGADAWKAQRTPGFQGR
ncbi:enoyl-CoA hydratase/isomerase family protein [Roseateles sp.]|uniref:enoyl-CoA hydratase/isomerase family protein n=1 Tax=Roseateles sp. TaxID=1971397 RepID=UPI003939289C